MTKLTRWEPFRELVSMRRDLDRLFDETFFRPMLSENGWDRPQVDVYQTEDEVVVKAALPGVAPEDVDIQVTGDTLSISGEMKEEKEDERASYQIRERRYQSFSRTLTLPTPVIAEKAKAEVVNGVLHLSLPKAEEAKPKSITVKAK